MTGMNLLHLLLANRSSPTTFDAASAITDDEIESILEAARWAPSAGNSQPWAFIVARRGEPDHGRLTARLAGSAARWAPSADLLVANLAHRYVADTDWDYSEFSLYDLGQAVAHMTVQAQALGLRVRQFRAFDRDGDRGRFRGAAALGGLHDVGDRPCRRRPGHDRPTAHAPPDPAAALAGRCARRPLRRWESRPHGT